MPRLPPHRPPFPNRTRSVGPWNPPAGAGSGSVLEAPALVAGLDDLAMVGQTVEQGRGHLGVAEDGRPFAEGEIGGDDDRGALVEPAHEVEEQLPAGLGEGQVAERCFFSCNRCKYLRLAGT